ERGPLALLPDELRAVDGDRPRLRLERLAAARPAIEALAFDLDRGICRRALELLAGRDAWALRGPPRVLEPPVAVSGVRAPAEPGHDAIGLGQVDQEALRARRPPHEHEQQTGRERVERPGVADADAPAEPSADPGHDVVRGQAGRLGVEQDAVRRHRPT